MVWAILQPPLLFLNIYTIHLITIITYYTQGLWKYYIKFFFFFKHTKQCVLTEQHVLLNNYFSKHEKNG